MTAATDVRYGRRGGRLTAWDGRPYDGHPFPHELAPTCSVCHLPMVLGQPGRHWRCVAPCASCGALAYPSARKCDCGAPRPSESSIRRGLS